MGFEVGIDEAGRGSLIGPIIIGIAKTKNISELGEDIQDSKKLTSESRKRILKKYSNIVSFDQIVIDCQKIDNAVYKNLLNDLQVSEINEYLMGFNGGVVKIDSQGNSPKYLSLIKWSNPDKTVIMVPKADSKYKIVSLAAIHAKEYRDKMISDLKRELNLDFGSGYPADPKCKTILSMPQNRELLISLNKLRVSWKTSF